MNKSPRTLTLGLAAATALAGHQSSPEYIAEQKARKEQAVRTGPLTATGHNKIKLAKKAIGARQLKRRIREERAAQRAARNPTPPGPGIDVQREATNLTDLTEEVKTDEQMADTTVGAGPLSNPDIQSNESLLK